MLQKKEIVPNINSNELLLLNTQEISNKVIYLLKNKHIYLFNLYLHF